MDRRRWSILLACAALGFWLLTSVCAGCAGASLVSRSFRHAVLWGAGAVLSWSLAGTFLALAEMVDGQGGKTDG